MLIFGKNKSKIANPEMLELEEDQDQPLSIEERAEYLRENAIQYIVELPDRDLERFIESARLIRDGRRKLEGVKTEVEKQLEREAKEQPAEEISDDDLDNMLEEDDLASAFLDDDQPSDKETGKK